MERDIKVDINTISITPTAVSITSISIEVFKLVLNSFIELRVTRNTDSGIYDIQHFKIEGDDYKSINTTPSSDRDEAIIQNILTRLGQGSSSYSKKTS